MKIHFFVFLFLSKIILTLSKHPAICFLQTLQNFKIAEPISYSEAGALMLSPNSPVFTVRCICPISANDRTLKVRFNQETVADPKICSNRVRAVMDYAIVSPTEVQTFYIGFQIWEPSLARHRFPTMIEIAFNKSLRTPVYAKYRYRSPNLNYFVFWGSRNYEPNYEYEKNPTLFGGYDVSELYSAESQNEIFSQFRNSRIYKDIINTNKPILVQQQLAQHNDFLMETWKEATYFDVNTTPMFREVQFTWQKIETFVIIQRHLFITTGVSMVKTFLDSSATPVELYLNQKTTPYSTPVPKIFWKALQYTNYNDDEENKYGLLVIMHNDPLYQSNDPLCAQISSSKVWDDLFNTELDEMSRNIAYTCELNQENLRKLSLPLSMPGVENFLNVEEVQKRFDTDNPEFRPVFRFT